MAAGCGQRIMLMEKGRLLHSLCLSKRHTKKNLEAKQQVNAAIGKIEHTSNEQEFKYLSLLLSKNFLALPFLTTNRIRSDITSWTDRPAAKTTLCLNFEGFSLESLWPTVF